MKVFLALMVIMLSSHVLSKHKKRTLNVLLKASKVSDTELVNQENRVNRVLQILKKDLPASSKIYNELSQV